MTRAIAIGAALRGLGGPMDADMCATAADELDKLREALRDIAFGATMMMDAPGNAGLKRYAAEVKRVAQAALS